MKKAVIGIDPGKTGAAALLAGHEIKVHDFTTTQAASRQLRMWVSKYEVELVLMEKPGRVGHINGKKAHGYWGQTELRRNMGIWEGLVVAFGMPLETVAPNTWQSKIFCPMKGDAKEKSRRSALLHHPQAKKIIHLKKHHNRADALNIATVAARKMRGRRWV